MKNLLACAALVTAIVGFAAPPPVEATNFAWTVGGGFHVGGAQFHVTMRDGHYGGPSYFYRTPRHISAASRTCHGACYRGQGQYFHHPYCPVAEAYFHSYGFNSHDLFARHAPPWRGPFARGNRWGPYYAPGHQLWLQAGAGYWQSPVPYRYYGYGNPNRQGARYERWNRNAQNPNRNYSRDYSDD